MLVHRLEVPDRELGTVERRGPADVLHAAGEVDEAVAQARLAASRLAGETHDLAVGDPEGDTVDGLHVAAQRPVVDLEIVDLEAHGYMLLSRGLNTSSSPTFIT